VEADGEEARLVWFDRAGGDCAGRREREPVGNGDAGT
jgi:hypothetical protein